jgi:hypothetical protein
MLHALFPRIGEPITGGGHGHCHLRPRSGDYFHLMRGLVVLSIISVLLEVAMLTTRRTPKTLHIDGLPTIHPNAAGIDIGADEIVVAVPPDRDPMPVRSFRTFPPDLVALVSWLISCGIDTVALEFTGVYWVPLYELLEQYAITAFLVNARHVKTEYRPPRSMQRQLEG